MSYFLQKTQFTTCSRIWSLVTARLVAESATGDFWRPTASGNSQSGNSQSANYAIRLFRDSYGWHHGVTYHTRQFPPNYRIRDFTCHAMWASEHRGLRCWFFRGVLFHFSASSIFFAQDSFLRHWLLLALPVVDPPWPTYFPATHDPRVVVPPTPVSPPDVGTLCVCHSSCCSGAPPPPPQKTDMQYHVPPRVCHHMSSGNLHDV